MNHTGLYGRLTKNREHAVPAAELLLEAIQEGRAIRLIWPYDEPDELLENVEEPSTTVLPVVREDHMADADCQRPGERAHGARHHHATGVECARGSTDRATARHALRTTGFWAPPSDMARWPRWTPHHHP